jgi:hypothetical protein
MRSLADREILDVWENGQGLAPVARALVMLAVSGAGAVDSLARLSIGRRDAALLRLRAATFGLKVDGLSDCPSCGEVLDVSFLTDAILVDAPALEVVSVVVGEYQVEARPATGADVAAIVSERSGVDPRLRLFSRCIASARLRDQAIPVDILPEEVLTAVEDALLAADPQAEVLLDLACPSCGHGWSVPFDIGTFFWAEIGTRARRVLEEIHRLASAYGWTEREVLDLGPARRRAYLEMVGE